MKKTAIVVDFDPSFLKNTGLSAKYDLFVLDRLKETIDNVEMLHSKEFKDAFTQESTVKEFYDVIAPHYKEVFCLFLSYNYLNVEDYLMTDRINGARSPYCGKMHTYLINYLNQDRERILQTAMELLEKEYTLRDIIIRIHGIRKKETYSVNDLLFKYISCIL